MTEGKTHYDFRPATTQYLCMTIGKDQEMDLTLQRYMFEDIVVVVAEGEIDVYTAPRLRAYILEILKDYKWLIIDMTKVTFLDHTGLGVLVGVLKRIKKADGWLGLVVELESILKVFRITGLTKVFDIFSSMVDALETGAARQDPK